MSLFNAPKVTVAQVKETIAERRPGTHRSPQYAALLAENKQLKRKLRHAASAIDALEKRNSDLELAQGTQAELDAEYGLDVQNTSAGYTVCPATGRTDHHPHSILCFSTQPDALCHLYSICIAELAALLRDMPMPDSMS